MDSSDNVVNIESYVTLTTSGSAIEGSGFDDPSYNWVDPSVLKIPTRLRDSDSLDQVLDKNSFLKSDCPSDTIMADIYGR